MLQKHKWSATVKGALIGAIAGAIAPIALQILMVFVGAHEHQGNVFEMIMLFLALCSVVINFPYMIVERITHGHIPDGLLMPLIVITSDVLAYAIIGAAVGYIIQLIRRRGRK